MLAMMALVFSACGGSSSTDGNANPSGGGGIATISGDEAVIIVNTIATTSLMNALNVSQSVQANAQAMFIGGKAMNVSACTWYDAAGSVIDTSTPQAMMAGMSIVVTIVCEEACTGNGTQSISISNASGTELFSGTPFSDGMIMEVTFNSCPVTNQCGTNTLDGVLTITATGMTSNPCNATLSIASQSMTIDGAAPPATVNMTFNITAAGDCSTVSNFDCDAMLSDNSTMFDGQTTYDKDAICDMVNNPSCP